MSEHQASIDAAMAVLAVFYVVVERQRRGRCKPIF